VDTTLDEAAEHLAVGLSRIAGIQEVRICSRDGNLLGTAPGTELGREAFLAAFIGRRAESLGDGDLRGWGEKLVNGRLTRIVLAGSGRETMIVAHRNTDIWLSLAPGASADTLEPTVRLLLEPTVRLLLERYG
jgi:hypothetical protein